ncbi:MAG TPA: hypothetical protein VGE97_03560 [Nitrososphaera sp.]|jgi:hypothetical protein
MPKNLFFYLFTATVLAGVLPIVMNIAYVYAQPFPGSPDNQSPPPGSFPNPYGPPPQFNLPFDQPLTGPTGDFSHGPIASIQNDKSGQPAWLAIGNWRGNLLSFNETTIENNNGGNASNGAAGAVFTADFRMIMLNGSESHSHSHVITNFELSNISSDTNGTRTYTGNATVSMPEGPVANVPTTVKVSGEIISIMPDPATLDEHYGNTPIYGVVGEGLGNNMMGPPPSPPGQPPVT